MGLLDFQLNSSPGPELFSSPGLLRVPKCPNPESPWSAQPQSLPPRISPECPKSLLAVPSAQPQSFSGVPNPRVPASETPWSAQPRECLPSAQPQSVPGVPNPRVSLPREGGDVRSKILSNVLYRTCHSLVVHILHKKWVLHFYVKSCQCSSTSHVSKIGSEKVRDEAANNNPLLAKNGRFPVKQFRTTSI